MDCSHFISFDENPLAFVLRQFFLTLNCAQIFVFYFFHNDWSIIVCFCLVCFGIDLHLFAHKITLCLPSTTLHLGKNYAEKSTFHCKQCDGEAFECDGENNGRNLKERGKVFAPETKLTINLHDNWLELGCHGARRLQRITNCQPPYWINEKRIYFT